MENVRKHVDVRLVQTKKKLLKLSAKSTFKACKIFNEDLVGVQLSRVQVKMCKPGYCGMCILDLSKLAMYEKRKYGQKVQLQMTDTDSLLFFCETDNIYEDMMQDQDLFDLSDYPKDHPLYCDKNKKVLGKMKDECGAVPIRDFVGLRSKMYSFRCGEKEEKRAKGIAKATVKKDLRFEDYKNTLSEESQKRSAMTIIRSHSHHLVSEKLNKCSLSSFDDKKVFVKLCAKFSLRTLQN